MIDRRDFIKLSAATLALAGCNPDSKTTIENKKLNILFVVIDDLNSWIGCLSHLREGVPEAKTPNLDRLAAQGMLFTNAHTPVPWCMPARNNTFTGLYANDSHIYSDEEFRKFLPDIRTLPQHFMDNGYYALAGGKLFHDSYPETQSWNELNQFERPPSQRRQHPSLNHVEGVDENDTFDWGQINVDDKELTDAKIADWAIQSLQRNYSKPFFMGVGFRFPHLPWYLPEHFLNLYPLDKISLPWVKEDDLDDVPAAGKKMAFYNPFENSNIDENNASLENSDYGHVAKSGQWKKAVQAYLAAISCTDEQLGRVLDELEKSQYAKNTVIVLWSDNGFHLGEKLHWRKFTLWDQATRIPLMLKIPGVTHAGSKSNQAVSLVDLYPTLNQVCGLKNPAHQLSGQSLLPLVLNPDAKKETPAFVTFGKGNDSVVDENWRYIRYADGSEELYDHRSDPHEWTNLADNKEYSPIKLRLNNYLKPM